MNSKARNRCNCPFAIALTTSWKGERARCAFAPTSALYRTLLANLSDSPVSWQEPVAKVKKRRYHLRYRESVETVLSGEKWITSWGSKLASRQKRERPSKRREIGFVSKKLKDDKVDEMGHLNRLSTDCLFASEWYHKEGHTNRSGRANTVSNRDVRCVSMCLNVITQ